MPRNKHCRRIGWNPPCRYYKPQGVPLSTLEEVRLAADEIEAIRLADLEEMYQADAADNMGVSRQTFGRILESAHIKIAQAIRDNAGISVPSTAGWMPGWSCSLGELVIGPSFSRLALINAIRT